MKKIFFNYSLRKSYGFTLVEMAIALVIIGLIVGGILVGRDLIHASEIRATVRQFEQFDAAVNTFLGKYGGLPGDLSTASQFGFNAATNGNGDGVIGWCTVSMDCYQQTNGSTNEYVNFWYHLGHAGLIPPYTAQPAGANPVAGIDTPPTKISAVSCSQSGWAIKSDITIEADIPHSLSAHHFLLNNNAVPRITAPLDNGGCYSPANAYNIDVKIDDGVALRGRVRAWSNSVGTNPPRYRLKNGGLHPEGLVDDPQGLPGCVNDDFSIYNAEYTGADQWVLCNLAIKASF